MRSSFFLSVSLLPRVTSVVVPWGITVADRMSSADQGARGRSPPSAAAVLREEMKTTHGRLVLLVAAPQQSSGSALHLSVFIRILKSRFCSSSLHRISIFHECAI
jgi:hypothetical protein